MSSVTGKFTGGDYHHSRVACHGRAFSMPDRVPGYVTGAAVADTNAHRHRVHLAQSDRCRNQVVDAGRLSSGSEEAMLWDRNHTALFSQDGQDSQDDAGFRQPHSTSCPSCSKPAGANGVAAPVRPAHDMMPRPRPVDSQSPCHPPAPSQSPSNCQLDGSDPIASNPIACMERSPG